MESSHSYISSFLTLSYHNNDPHYHCFKSKVQLIATPFPAVSAPLRSASCSREQYFPIVDIAVSKYILLVEERTLFGIKELSQSSILSEASGTKISNVEPSLRF
jgi:hypothetical protein